MSSDNSFIDYLQELLSGLGKVSLRRMFGGHGIYYDGLMFALAFEQRLFLKVDAETRAAFAAAGCEAWTYEGKDKTVQMSYWTVPDEAMDSTEAMTPWARRAFAAALRKANAKPSARPKAAKKPASAGKAAKAAATPRAKAAKAKSAGPSETSARNSTRKPRG
ncbi:DNA transformation protein [Tahibacter aquaticus]|uniref:DNA transformation protein n=1 Tax=Tahibacter aquaticus TaxID=520092 RepID=A0A4R6YQD9_9GAMM|nr:TfoX/Sxy family protein [Tahibacter aquaticus]TDR40083.1 DNA transformation protein [Tahibacter aquaticus]